MSAYGQWPWPRTILADLLTRLYELQAAAIAFDVIFPEPDRSSPNEAVKHFRNVDEATRERLIHLPSNDEIFADVIGRGRVVLGRSGTHTINTRSREKPPETAFATLGSDPRPYLIAFPHMLYNLPKLEQAAAGRGLFSIRTDRDGMVRRVPIVMEVDGNIVPALTLDLLRVVAGSNTILIRADESGIRSVAVPGLELPTDQNGRIWIYFGPHDKAQIRFGKGRNRRKYRSRENCRQACPGGHVGDWAVGREDHARPSGDAGGRGACSTAGSGTDRFPARRSELRDRR